MVSDLVEIRSFMTSDADECVQMRAEAFRRLFFQHIAPELINTAINAYKPDKFIETAAHNPFFVATRNQEPVGFIGSQFLGKNTIEILFLYVKLDHLKKGIGSKLIRFWEDWLQKNNPEIDRIIVKTIIPDYNQRFYEKHGFKKSGTSFCRYQAGQIEALCLMKKLK